MAGKVIVTTNVLRWARESARITIAQAAAKIPVDIDKLESWEQGTDYPTLAQLEKLAKAYRRPSSLFFLPEPPKDFQTLQDFRAKGSKDLGTASLFMIREIQQKQAWLADTLRDNESDPLSFVGKFKSTDDPAKVAHDILLTLNIDPTAYTKVTPLLEWISKAESKGIFISRASNIHSRLKLDSDEMQGFSIADKHAPFVFINSEDWDTPQLFTIVHELAHVWLGESGVSNEVEAAKLPRSNTHPVELFCNAVAAEALMPEEVMRSLDAAVFEDGDNVFAKAKKMAVSSFALLVRARQLNLISDNKYRVLRKDADEAFKHYEHEYAEKMARQKEKQKALPKEERSGPNYYLLLANKNGQQFTRIVMDAYHGGGIPPSQASHLLNTSINNFPKLEAFLHN